MVNKSINIIKTKESLNIKTKESLNIKTKESLISGGQQFHQYHQKFILSFVLMILMELLTITV
jgi:hypothetical protein